MNKIIKKLFIKNYNDVQNPVVRTAYGVVAGAVGIIANVILFALKLFVGILSGSVAVIADAINNMLDFLTSIITIIGFKFSSKPADKEHPYGHQRIEHVISLIIACVVMFIGFEAGKGALDKVLSASPTDFSTLTCIVLGASILIKILLAFMFNSFAKDIDSDALKAMSADSRNDAISTTVVLFCAIAGIIWGVQLDGYLGILVSLLVMISAIKLIKETIDPLIGIAPDKEFVQNIKNKLKSYDGILDIHDLIVHNYGPNKTFASVHIEVDSSVDVMISHDLADNIERDFMKELNVFLVCHLDPVDVNNIETQELKEKIKQLLLTFDPPISIHDFRVVKGHTHTNIIFDAVVPFGRHDLEQGIIQAVNNELGKCDKKYYAVIEFEHDFNQ